MCVCFFFGGGGGGGGLINEAHIICPDVNNGTKLTNRITHGVSIYHMPTPLICVLMNVGYFKMYGYF